MYMRWNRGKEDKTMVCEFVSNLRRADDPTNKSVDVVSPSYISGNRRVPRKHAVFC